MLGRRKWQIGVIGLALWSHAVACSVVHADRQSQNGALPAKQATRVVTDEAGRRITVPAEIERIVSLAPSLTEIVYSLGISEKLVGDTVYCDSPEAATEKPHVGSPLSPNMEAIVALRPDIVLVTAIDRRETVTVLERLGIAVYESDPHTVRQTLDSIATMSQLLGAGQAGAEILTRLQARLDALHARLADRPLVHVLFVVWEDPLQSVGPNTIIADALRWAGAESVVVSRGDWPHVSMEEVVRLQPEYIVLTRSHIRADSAQVAELAKRPVWKSLRAVETGHVVVLSQEVARPSPGLIDDIEALARVVHPEAFAPDGKNASLGKDRNFTAMANNFQERAACVR